MRCAGPVEVLVCEADEQGCLAWDRAGECGQGEFCEGRGECVRMDICVDECSPGLIQCDGIRGIKACQPGPEGCFVWQSIGSCDPGLQCEEDGSDVICEGFCEDQCERGARRCLENSVVFCAVGANGCAQWDLLNTCSDSQRCEGQGRCVELGGEDMDSEDIGEEDIGGGFWDRDLGEGESDAEMPDVDVDVPDSVGDDVRGEVETPSSSGSVVGTQRNSGSCSSIPADRAPGHAAWWIVSGLAFWGLRRKR